MGPHNNLRHKFIILLLCTLFCCAGCRFGRPHGSNTKFTTGEKNGRLYTEAIIENDSLFLNIECLGSIQFNKEKTSIASISSGGYVRYKRNDKKLFAENMGSNIFYELKDNGEDLGFNAKGKKLIREAVRDIIYTDSLSKRSR